MLRFVICALGALLVTSACAKSTIRSQEGHACSTNPDDDPQLVCTPAQDLVCITTYSRMVTNEQEAKKFDGGIRNVYVCRMACNDTAQCAQPGDICCRGHIYGKTYNRMGGCVPPGSCETLGDGEDAGAPADTGVPADARAGDTAAPPAGDGGTGS